MNGPEYLLWQVNGRQDIEKGHQAINHPHETPHMKSNGGCDCFCDFCLAPLPKGGSTDYYCICSECNGQCDIPHHIA